MRHEAETSKAQAEVFLHGQCFRIVDAELHEGRNRGVLLPLARWNDDVVLAVRCRVPRRATPDTLAAEQVESASAIFGDSRRSSQQAGLIP